MDDHNGTDKPFENSEVNEEKLEEVSGGILYRGLCHFEPARPYKIQWRGGDCYALCKSTCIVLAICSCEGTARCIDKYHIIERPPNDTIAYAFPFPEWEHNHNKPSKRIEVNPWVSK